MEGIKNIINGIWTMIVFRVMILIETKNIPINSDCTPLLHPLISHRLFAGLSPEIGDEKNYISNNRFSALLCVRLFPTI